MKSSSNQTLMSLSRNRTSSTRSRGFTLVEILVALALFSVLMIVVFVPLTQAARFLSVGKTRTGLQQAANQTMTQLQRDLQRAIYVYPNAALPGVTDVSPYVTSPVSPTPTPMPPYIQGGNRVNNTSRIDMLLPELDNNGNVKYPVTPSKYIVTYYARRLDSTKDYSPYENPILLFRAQYPYLNANGTTFQLGGNPNADVSTTRYSSGTTRGLKWLTENTDENRGEFNLADGDPDNPTDSDRISQDATTGGLVPGNHIAVTPRNVALVASNATWPTPATIPTSYNLIPNTTFTCADTNSDGKIDQVTVNLVITQFDSRIANGANNPNQDATNNLNFQKFSLAQTVNLPNVR